ncbi:hypothetical protein NIES4103_06430 [Nostoc sp. NIES-4103]|nr:hypothetical protein NIES4103_06430 [Nostoc sp. NIES-4103]
MNKPLCKPLEISANLDLYQWLKEQAEKYKLKYLLAHAEDGVIWGEFRNGELVTAHDAFSQSPQLRSCTLQQCRIFGANVEIMLWQTYEGFKARIIQDDQSTEFIPEHQILWGTKVEEVNNGFTLVTDGQQGLHHAVPLTGIEFDSNQKLYRPLRLIVRHYIDDKQQSGLARIYLSRLVNLTTEKELTHAAKTHS